MLSPEPTSTPEESKHEEPPRDEEGLLTHYDVILCGTGLVQSILASALARAGKSVLHCDGADCYGEMDAVWSWSQLQSHQESGPSSRVTPGKRTTTSIPLFEQGSIHSLQWHDESTKTIFGIALGTSVQTPYGKGKVTSLGTQNSSSLEVSLDNWKLAGDQAPTVYFSTEMPKTDDKPKSIAPVDDPIKLEAWLAEHHNIQSVESMRAQKLLADTRSWALDLSPAFVLAAGRAVEGMLASGVADYLEFKCVEGLLWLDNSSGTNALHRVPCSKNDVFATKLLKPMDKRRLMKFIQLSMDYATQVSAAAETARVAQEGTHDEAAPESNVQSLNERHLNQGRSLARPQNKAVATQELQTLQQCMSQENQLTFDDYLKAEHKLSPSLRHLVRYALALETEEASVRLSQGMSSLRHHLQALGRYGVTAFLMPMYGSGELSQAFCRSAAVFGATYLLRRAPIKIMCSTDETSTSVSSVFVSNDQDDVGPDKHGNGLTTGKEIPCEHVIVPEKCLSDPTMLCSTDTRILRRMIVLNGRLVNEPSNTNKAMEQRHVIFIPPGAVGNSHAIHCVALDESVMVAPVGCTLLHLTTTITNVDPLDILDKACKALLQNAEMGVEEIYHTEFSHANSRLDEVNQTQPKGFHKCSHNGQALTVDVAFEQAESIFHTICPGKEFLGLAPELGAMLDARNIEGYDEERYMLESALGMIGEPKEKTVQEVETPPQKVNESESVDGTVDKPSIN